MINRKKEVKKSSFNSVLGSLLTIVIVVGLAAYGFYFMYFPKEINLREVKNEVEYNFNIVKAANIAEDTDNPGFYYVSIMIGNKNVAEVYVDEDKKEELKDASMDNPVRFVGIAILMDKTADGRDEYVEQLKQFHFTDMNKYYDVMFFEKEEPVIPYLMIAFVLIVFGRHSYEIYISLKARKQVLNFLEENPLYNEYEPRLSIHKNVAVVKDYLISTKSPAAILNIDKCVKSTLVRHRYNLITTHFNLSYIDNERKTETITLPRLKKEKAQELINYLDNLGKYKAV